MPVSFLPSVRTKLARGPQQVSWRKKAVYALCCLLVMTLVAFAARAAETAPLRIAVDVPYPPFTYIDEDTGKLTGFDADMAEALCRQIGRDCQFVITPFDEMIPSITARKVDIAVAGMVRTEERLKHVIFTERYFRSNSIFVTLVSNSNTQEFSMEGKSIAVQKGTIQEEGLKGLGVPSERVVRLHTSDEVLAAVKQKKADLAFIDGVTGYYTLKTEENADLEITGEPVIMPHMGEGCIVLHPSLTALRDSLNNAIMELRKNGTYNTINRKYFTFSIY